MFSCRAQQCFYLSLYPISGMSGAFGGSTSSKSALKHLRGGVYRISAGLFAASVSLLCPKLLAFFRVDQLTLFLSTCSAYIIQATHLGLKFLGHLVTLKIALNMQKNHHSTSTFVMELYLVSLDLQCIVCKLDNYRQKICKT